MPILSEILQSCEAQGSVYFCDTLQPPWNLDFTKRNFHCVRRGGCELVSHDGRVETLGPGDVVIVLNNEEHSLRSTEKENGENLILCGSFTIRSDMSRLLFRNFPPVLIFRESEITENHWLRTTLDYLVSETQKQEPGHSLINNKLTEVLLVQFIRHYVQTKAPEQTLAVALYDPHIGKAITLMHEKLAFNWTLDNLGREIGLSRAAFAQRFKQMTGEPMFSYLTEIRMIRAKRMLEKSNDSIIDIAENVGYASDIAFTRAFKKVTGQSPSQYRKHYVGSRLAN